jgi:hypothetical protein
VISSQSLTESPATPHLKSSGVFASAISVA